MEDEATREAIAYHEAGHAVMSFKLKRAVLRVSIVPDDDGNLGHVLNSTMPSLYSDTYSLNDATFQTNVIRAILISYAGPLAEERSAGKPNTDGAAGDRAKIVDLALHVLPEENERDLFLRWLEARARNLISSPPNWVQIQGLATALLSTPSMSGSKAKAVCKGAIQEAIEARRTGKPWPPPREEKREDRLALDWEALSKKFPPRPAPIDPNFLTLAQVAAVLRITERAAGAMLKSGKLPKADVDVGGPPRWRTATLAKWVDEACAPKP
jgi:Peptidase family M41